MSLLRPPPSCLVLGGFRLTTIVLYNTDTGHIQATGLVLVNCEPCHKCSMLNPIDRHIDRLASGYQAIRPDKSHLSSCQLSVSVLLHRVGSTIHWRWEWADAGVAARFVDEHAKSDMRGIYVSWAEPRFDELQAILGYPFCLNIAIPAGVLGIVGIFQSHLAPSERVSWCGRRKQLHRKYRALFAQPDALRRQCDALSDTATELSQETSTADDDIFTRCHTASANRRRVKRKGHIDGSPARRIPRW